mgnify:CR=1 FL=1
MKLESFYEDFLETAEICQAKAALCLAAMVFSESPQSSEDLNKQVLISELIAKLDVILAPEGRSILYPETSEIT